ncbi:hypothetical protein DOTSEDRAFT_37137 [Dothistroma septosporum NZE10]|uniref:Uncharacterized protein n=1 Tax=Dothistroma septosporum (strain NZE10 / CBS 128990) TaxID=675120 RepID=N1PHH3_DOTSN|nr:hypothetical protein DOTSEDRAFT_37137 [Dothistroma septosporum NZE10]
MLCHRRHAGQDPCPTFVTTKDAINYENVAMKKRTSVSTSIAAPQLGLQLRMVARTEGHGGNGAQNVDEAELHRRTIFAGAMSRHILKYSCGLQTPWARYGILVDSAAELHLRDSGAIQCAACLACQVDCSGDRRRQQTEPYDWSYHAVDGGYLDYACDTAKTELSYACELRDER